MTTNTATNAYSEAAIRALRETLGLSREDFAHVVGATLGTVTRWEQGKAVPSKLARHALDRLHAESGDKPCL